jgi:ATP-binding cassette subfamily C protein
MIIADGQQTSGVGLRLKAHSRDARGVVFRPAIKSFSLLHSREKITFIGIILIRVLVHGLDVLGLAAVGLVGAMVASGLNNQPEAEFFGVTVSVVSTEAYLWVVGAIAGFFVGKSVLAIFLLRVTAMFLARVEADTSIELARYLYSGDLHRVRSRSKGEIQWLVYSSTQLAFSSVLFAGAAIITEIALFLAIFATFLAVDVTTALILVAFFALVIGLFQLLVSQRLRRLGKGTARFARNVNNSVLDLTESFREATVLQKRDWFLQRFDLSRRGLARNKGIERFALSIPRYLIESALIIGMLALTVWQFIAGAEFGGLVVIGVFLAGGTRMMAALLPLQNAVSELRVYGPQAARAQDVISLARRQVPRPDDEIDVSDTELAVQIGGLNVRVEEISFTYPEGNEPALRDVSLTIKPGEFAALVGPSGAGKTTLADLILGIHYPSEGRIETAGLSPAALRKQQPGLVSYVPQNPGMVSGSVAQNVALGVDSDLIDEDRVWEVLGQAGLDAVVKDMADGIHTSLGEQSDALSGGQIQRLGIARALYTRPKLLVLDEATSALDAETEAGIAETIEGLRGETTLIVIAHRLSTIQHADVVFVIDEGRLVSQGSFSTVRKEVPLIERYVQLMTIKDSD